MMASPTFFRASGPSVAVVETGGRGGRGGAPGC